MKTKIVYFCNAVAVATGGGIVWRVESESLFGCRGDRCGERCALDLIGRHGDRERDQCDWVSSGRHGDRERDQCDWVSSGRHGDRDFFKVL